MRLRFILLFLLTPFVLFAQDLIPKPVSFEKREGTFRLNSSTVVLNESASEEVKSIAESMRLRIASTTHLNPELVKVARRNFISFSINSELAAEAYTIHIDNEKAELKGGSGRSLFYAYQTLLQLFEDQIYNSEASYGFRLTLPACDIFDQPRFGYRGSMLDVGRHLMPVSFIKKYIDLLAMYKFNQFHWHLTEDQGWRIEIKKYPKLTEVGAYRKESMVGHYSDQKFDGKQYGGFYTQEEVKEIVAYAASKYINVIPEIEMPGHAQAALASYPELGCTGGPYEVRTLWGVSENVYCPYETTFTFLQDVLTEVMELFPSEYIHIGGDECPKTTWEESEFCQNLIKSEGLGDEHGLQSYFISRIDSFLTSKGRKLIGWDEILEGGLSPNATVMSWRGTEGGIEAARQKHDVIMSPNSYYYLDYYQGDPATEPLAIGGNLPLEKVYSYEPFTDELTEDQQQYILGVQGNLWTEYIATPEKAEYMLFPRLLAVAETGWSPQGEKDYENFVSRVQGHFGKLLMRNVNFSRSIWNLESEVTGNPGQGLTLWLNTVVENPVIRYNLGEELPDGNSPVYDPEKGIKIEKGTMIRAALFDKDNKPYGNVFTTTLKVNKATGKTYEYRSKPTRYTGGSTYALTDGKVGVLNNNNTWVGLNGDDLDLTLDLGEITEINELIIGFLHAPGSWIMYPKNLQISTSEDGEKFRDYPVYDLTVPEGASAAGQSMMNLNGVKARYLKIKAENYGSLPEGHAGAGKPAWLFVDEIEVN
ncbi:family 20 glycosylhydrolase [Jiulongibacter sediminis]|jgi:hexosaminidase|uniref:glycoside hydrolase family 20 protein n=1 Tax=Jiulongibacter sediminis TaxID=1605367 RepID=UPI0026ED0199|nr:family 20 glycosylhydrolase [Jiulongibacter sediminis]